MDVIRQDVRQAVMQVANAEPVEAVDAIRLRAAARVVTEVQIAEPVVDVITDAMRVAEMATAEASWVDCEAGWVPKTADVVVRLVETGRAGQVAADVKIVELGEAVWPADFAAD